MIWFGFLVRSLMVLALFLGALAAQAEDHVPEITTDTPDYCGHLYQRVQTMRLAATVPPPHAVLDLSTEGLRMCETGLARGGVMRLRRALAILMHPDEGE